MAPRLQTRLKEFNDKFEKKAELKKTREEIEAVIIADLNKAAKTGDLSEFKKIVESYDVRYFYRKDRVKRVKLPENSSFAI